jgi:tRNA uridine 5-carboxymethylaminomethyl modification enzyme
LDGTVLTGRAVIVATGTFLNGVIHIGLHSYPAGRANEPPSHELGEDLKKTGFRVFRLKTGTPMRLDAASINWTRFESQAGDVSPVPFSYWTKTALENKVLCHVGYTNALTHKVIRKNLDKSPLYSGKITGIGPRYCPSIEDKVVKFPHHPRHQFFLEPEGLSTNEIYVNGMSSSLPFEVQMEILKSIPGLDEAKIIRPAYGIEYDAVSPIDLHPTLETRKIRGLYFAGQINGTSGYEEAAAQGLMAGINACLRIQKRPPFIMRRDQAYIGVLINDLITKGVEEPYRLFTSRAESRLHLRIDNADTRLVPLGRKYGLIKDSDFHDFEEKQRKIKDTMAFLGKEKIKDSKKDTVSLLEYLKKPEIRIKNMLEYGRILSVLNEEEMRHIESEIKYEGYLKKQAKEISRLTKADRMRIPVDLDYGLVPGLTREVIEKLGKYKPSTLGEAKNIPGMTPAAALNLSFYLEIRRKRPLPAGGMFHVEHPIKDE